MLELKNREIYNKDGKFKRVKVYYKIVTLYQACCGSQIFKIRGCLNFYIKILLKTLSNF